MEGQTKGPKSAVIRPSIKGQEVLGPSGIRETLPTPSGGRSRSREDAVASAFVDTLLEGLLSPWPLSKVERPVRIDAVSILRPISTPSELQAISISVS